MMLQIYSYFLPFPGDRGACVIFFHCVCILRWKICSGCRGASDKCVRLTQIEVVGSAWNTFSRDSTFHGFGAAAHVRPQNMWEKNCQKSRRLKQIFSSILRIFNCFVLAFIFEVLLWKIVLMHPHHVKQCWGRFYVHFRPKWGVSVCRGTRLRFGQLWLLTI